MCVGHAHTQIYVFLFPARRFFELTVNYDWDYWELLYDYICNVGVFTLIFLTKNATWFVHSNIAFFAVVVISLYSFIYYVCYVTWFVYNCVSNLTSCCYCRFSCSISCSIISYIWLLSGVLPSSILPSTVYGHGWLKFHYKSSLKSFHSANSA